MAKTVSELVIEWLQSYAAKDILLSITAATPVAATSAAVYSGEPPPELPENMLDIFTDVRHLPTATARIHIHNARRANFLPSQMSSYQLGQQFTPFVNSINSTPFFFLSISKREDYENQYTNLEDQIRYALNLLHDITGLKEEEVGKLAEQMVSGISSETPSLSRNHIFLINHLDFRDVNQPTVGIYYTQLLIEREGIANVRENTTSTVWGYRYRVLPDLIAAHAPSLTSLNDGNVEVWIELMTSLSECDNPDKSNKKQ